MPRLKHLALLFFCSLLFPAMSIQAQSPAPTLQDEATDVVRRNPYNNFVTLSVENDSLGGGTDRNYTSGVRLSYFDVNADIPYFIDRIAEIIPTFDINPTTSLSWSIGQNLYTPKDIKTRRQAPNDRPWAGWVYGSAGLTTLTGNHIDELELTLGMVGPSAQGEWAQKNVHSLIGSPQPKGWDNQLKNEPGAIASWRRRWPEKINFEAGGLYGALEPNINLSLGNIYTYAGSGVTFRLSPAEDRWQDNPPRVRPAIPGSGFFDVPDKMSWYLFAGADGRAVAQNIFLDGNSFADSHSVDKKSFVADLNAGLALTFGRARLSYSLVYRTEEFDRQDGGSAFGSLSLSYRF